METRANTARLRVSLGGGLVLVVVALVAAILVVALAPRGETTTIAPTAETEFVAEVSRATLFVHIMGEVERPGLYELQEGDRAVDAVAAAGGYTAEADRTQLNLARFLSDGEQIIIPREGEVAAPGSGAVPGKININSADSAALQTLPGVGPALAERIIAWRAANGRFVSVDDLLNVTGIGAKTLAGFRDSVTV